MTLYLVMTFGTVRMVTEELEVIISKDEKYLLDSKQSAASIFSFGEGRGS